MNPYNWCPVCSKEPKPDCRYCDRIRERLSMSGDYLDDLADATVGFFEEVVEGIKKGATHVRKMVEEPRCAITIKVDYDPNGGKPPVVEKCGKPAKLTKLAESELTLPMCPEHAAITNK